MRVLGIDPGATVGLALLDVGKRTAEHIDCEAVRWVDSSLPQTIHHSLFDVDLVAIERVEHVHGSARMGSSYAEGLALGNWIGGVLAGIARSRSLHVVTVEAAAWRKALTGEPYAPDARVKRTILLRVPNWPSKSNAHERDAAGVALWAGLRGAA